MGEIAGNGGKILSFREKLEKGRKILISYGDKKRCNI